MRAAHSMSSGSSPRSQATLTRASVTAERDALEQLGLV
jgi:hypothetical protein